MALDNRTLLFFQSVRAIGDCLSATAWTYWGDTEQYREMLPWQMSVRSAIFSHDRSARRNVCSIVLLLHISARRSESAGNICVDIEFPSDWQPHVHVRSSVCVWGCVFLSLLYVLFSPVTYIYKQCKNTTSRWMRYRIEMPHVLLIQIVFLYFFYLRFMARAMGRVWLSISTFLKPP